MQDSGRVAFGDFGGLKSSRTEQVCGALADVRKQSHAGQEDTDLPTGDGINSRKKGHFLRDSAAACCEG